LSAMVSQSKKEWLRSLLDPAARFLAQLGIHPNVLTMTGLLLALLSGWFLGQGRFRLGALFLLVGGLFDMLDGAVARRSGKGSSFGAFLDSTMDRFAEIVPYLGLAYGLRERWEFLLPFLVITGSLMVSYTRARVEGLGGTCAVGMLERPERIVLVFLGLFIGGPFLPLALILLAAGSYFTTFQRIAHARKVL
jgi:CDP-diacylglycerol--glycerol-3-phosphate 3-phosphatidyltransferase